VDFEPPILEMYRHFVFARKLKMETPNVTRSRKNALKKLERAKTDLEFLDELKSQRSTTSGTKENANDAG
jgi:hypothetical protein